MVYSVEVSTHDTWYQFSQARHSIELFVASRWQVGHTGWFSSGSSSSSGVSFCMFPRCTCSSSWTKSGVSFCVNSEVSFCVLVA